jgi:hypothetical protein
VRFVSVLTPPLGLVDFGVAPVIGEGLAECSKELGIVGARRTNPFQEGGWEPSAPTRFGGSQFTFVGRAIVVLSDSCASRAPTIVAIASKVTFLAAASAPVNV